MKLYGYWRSSSSYRLRIVLGLKGIDFEYIAVNLLNGDQIADEHRSRNPLGQVPCLELADGELLIQSVAIMEYREELEPEPSLLPGDALNKARIRALVELVNSGIQPLQNLSVMKHIAEFGGDGKAFATHYNRRGLAALERLTHGANHPFLVGDQPTLADVCLIPQLYSARRFGIDIGEFPRLAAVEQACQALPAFQAAHPDNQPDAVS